MVLVGFPIALQVSSAMNSSLKSLKYSPIIPIILKFGIKIPKNLIMPIEGMYNAYFKVSVRKYKVP